MCGGGLHPALNIVFLSEGKASMSRPQSRVEGRFYNLAFSGRALAPRDRLDLG